MGTALTTIQHSGKVYEPGAKVSKSTFGDDWDHLVASGSVSEENNAESPPPTQQATAGQGEPLSDEEIKRSGDGTEEGRATQPGQTPAALAANEGTDAVKDFERQNPEAAKKAAAADEKATKAEAKA